MAPTKQEIQQVIGKIESEHGPMAFNDRNPVTIEREQVRILIEGLRNYAVFDCSRERFFDTL